MLLFLLRTTARFLPKTTPKFLFFLLFETLENKRLMGYAVKQCDSPSLLWYGQQCLRNTWCISINNMLSSTRRDEGTCELIKQTQHVHKRKQPFCWRRGNDFLAVSWDQIHVIVTLINVVTPSRPSPKG